MKYSVLEQTVTKKDLEIKEINMKFELKLNEKQNHHEYELECITKKVKIIIEKKDLYITQLNDELYQCKDSKSHLENALNEINQGISIPIRNNSNSSNNRRKN